ncbi:hypothetical protein Bcep1808_5172 [Burkholderia vietnamiensis G4]|uniref:Uncharacterized protein n=1 Tax=Burkholderia vietnamiensis (strain G4 / LMG 22486) TaxID=269482 RepID=A4JPC0_BURVG|nr:hypothetical protein Bcep1808_5172 [Burkholderia vietnamiensis G4]
MPGHGRLVSASEPHVKRGLSRQFHRGQHSSNPAGFVRCVHFPTNPAEMAFLALRFSPIIGPATNSRHISPCSPARIRDASFDHLRRT